MAVGGFLGRKTGMTQITGEGGKVIPVTLVTTPPCQVTLIRTKEKDGYSAIQLGVGTRRHPNKPLQGQMKKANIEAALQNFREVPGDAEGVDVGQTIKISDVFAAGERVRVTGTSKGKGFAGTVKRHHFNRGPMSHGSKFHRLPGSSGAGTTPGRVFPGSRRPGHMGDETVTIRRAEIVEINGEENYLLIKGAVPGPENGLILLRKMKPAGVKKS